MFTGKELNKFIVFYAIAIVALNIVFLSLKNVLRDSLYIFVFKMQYEIWLAYLLNELKL